MSTPAKSQKLPPNSLTRALMRVATRGSCEAMSSSHGIPITCSYVSRSKDVPIAIQQKEAIKREKQVIQKEVLQLNHIKVVATDRDHLNRPEEVNPKIERIGPKEVTAGWATEGDEQLRDD